MSLASEELDYICLEYLVVEDFRGLISHIGLAGEMI